MGTPTDFDFNQSLIIAEGLWNRGMVNFPEEPVRLSSGLLAPVYADTRRLTGSPVFWHRIVGALAGKITDVFSINLLYKSGDELVLAGIELGSVFHASALAYRMNLPGITIRKTVKGHGTSSLIEGMTAEEIRGRKVVIVEDVVTLGGNCLYAAKVLKEAGAEIFGCLAILSHELPGINDKLTQEFSLFRFLVTSRQVALCGLRKWNEGDSKGVRPEVFVRFENWQKDPFGWLDQ